MICVRLAQLVRAPWVKDVTDKIVLGIERGFNGLLATAYFHGGPGFDSLAARFII